MKISRRIVLLFFVALLFTLSQDVYANIVLKVASVNPSKSAKKKAFVKAYLPKEVKPEDIISKADLDIAYDTQQGSYYVYKEYLLDPGQVLEKEIELRDVWRVPESELEGFRVEAETAVSKVQNTRHEERMRFINDSIMRKLSQIESAQRVPPVNPERHISNYRENLKLLREIKDDLVVMRTILAQTTSGVDQGMMLKVFFAILGFLALIGGSFYFILQNQMQQIKTNTFDTTEAKENVEVEEEMVVR